MKLMEELKSHSSKWIKTKGVEYSNFYWQDIANQYEHHRKKTFQEEYRAFLTKYNVEYEENYVWD